MIQTHSLRRTAIDSSNRWVIHYRLSVKRWAEGRDRLQIWAIFPFRKWPSGFLFLGVRMSLSTDLYPKVYELLWRQLLTSRLRALSMSYIASYYISRQCMGQVLLGHLQWTVTMRLRDVKVTKERRCKAWHLKGLGDPLYNRWQEISPLSMGQVTKMADGDSTISKRKIPQFVDTETSILWMQKGTVISP